MKFRKKPLLVSGLLLMVLSLSGCAQLAESETTIEEEQDYIQEEDNTPDAQNLPEPVNTDEKDELFQTINEGNTDNKASVEPSQIQVKALPTEEPEIEEALSCPMFQPHELDVSRSEAKLTVREMLAEGKSYCAAAYFCLIYFSVCRNLSQIANFFPTDRNKPILQKQIIVHCVDAPYSFLFGHIQTSISIFRLLQIICKYLYALFSSTFFRQSRRSNPPFVSALAARACSSSSME